MEAPRSLVYTAMALSIASIGLSVYVGFGRGPVGSAPQASSCDDVRQEVAELKKAMEAPRGDVQRLAGRVAALEGSRAGGSPVGAPGEDAADAEDRPAVSARAEPSFPRYTSFEPPSKAISIRQEDHGGLSVTNTDPAMTGKDLLVNARAEDGSIHQVHIIVPAPGQ